MFWCVPSRVLLLCPLVAVVFVCVCVCLWFIFPDSRFLSSLLTFLVPFGTFLVLIGVLLLGNFVVVFLLYSIVDMHFSFIDFSSLSLSLSLSLSVAYQWCLPIFLFGYIFWIEAFPFTILVGCCGIIIVPIIGPNHVRFMMFKIFYLGNIIFLLKVVVFLCVFFPNVWCV